MAANKFRLALVQLAVGSVKGENLSRAAARVREAAAAGAQLVALPECFNSPYGTSYFAEYAESVPGPSTQAMADAARESNVFLVAGSVPERDGDRLYNTSTVFGPDGKLLATHRKVHLFDIDVPGKIRFQESEVLSAGNKLTTFDTPFCRVGLGICYDMRFAPMAQIYAQRGCSLLLYPGAFNMTTGPAHWELLQRARALDSQLYVAAVSPARSDQASYVAWGHSTVVSPWGEVVATTEHEETIVYADIDLGLVQQVREQIPVRRQARSDLYSVQDLQP